MKQPQGYRAYIPAPLPPFPPIRLDDELTRLLSDADRCLGRLDGVASVRLLDYLFEQPIVSVRMVEKKLECSYVTANKLIDQLGDLKLVKEITGQQRNRRYRYEPYLALFESPPAEDE